MYCFSRWLLDLFYPPACIVCRTRGFWVCTACLDSIRVENIRRDVEGLTSVRALGSYANPALRTMITGFKYQSALCIEPAIIELLERYKASHGHLNATVIVPVPSSKTRILDRGFDHVARLAELVRNTLSPQAEIRNALRRANQSLSNADLENHEARRGNVMGSFEVIGEVPGRVLLIDDVVTSGATGGECARLLRENGAKEVRLFTMASG